MCVNAWGKIQFVHRRTSSLNANVPLPFNVAHPVPTNNAIHGNAHRPLQ
jgi:hypothetical protein